jgi:hypothetical protein
MITLTAAVVFLGVAATNANTGGTFSTGFTALPVVFARMPLGNFFGAVWFFMLFLAAITSSLSMLQPAKAFFQEALGLSWKGATTLVTVLCLAGNVFVLYFSKGLTALDTLDFWVGTFMIFIVAGTQIICFGWVFGVDKGLALAHEGARIRIPGVFRFVMKYVSPAFLLVIFVGFCVFNAPDYVRTVLKGDPDAQEIALRGEAASGAWVNAARERIAADPWGAPAALKALIDAPGVPTTVASGAIEDLEQWAAELPGWSAVDGPLTWTPKPIPPDDMAIRAWIVILAVIALLLVTTAIGARRWRAMGLDLDGRSEAGEQEAEDLRAGGVA